MTGALGTLATRPRVSTDAILPRRSVVPRIAQVLQSDTTQVVMPTDNGIPTAPPLQGRGRLRT